MFTKNVAGQEPLYKRVVYEIRYKKVDYNSYSRLKRDKIHTAYEIYNSHNQVVEVGEYGLGYCKSHNDKKQKKDSGLIVQTINLYRVEDFREINTITYYHYDSLGKVILQELHKFYNYAKIDTTKTFFSYNDRGKLVQTKSIFGTDTTHEFYTYDSNDSLADIKDDKGTSHLDRNTIKRYDSLGKLVEEIIVRNGLRDSRFEYINDIFYHAVLGFNSENKLDYIEETYGDKDKPEKIFSKHLNTRISSFSKFKYHNRMFKWEKFHKVWLPKKIISYKVDFYSFKKSRYFITKYKYTQL